jgi:eukaryotic-like serine/threonine-protein kinase
MQQRTLASRYELAEPIGRGAVGQVWRAWDERRRRMVAVKVIQVAEIRNPEHLADSIGRFQREVAAVGMLRHPNIVTAFEAGRAGDELFLAMELAEGRPLADVIALREARGLGPLPVLDVLTTGEQVCAGLAAAHAAGIVHRDIKPGNLMVCSDRKIKIIDFGMALLLDDGSPRLTRRGQVVGTLAYMSPEQINGDDVDGRADLYSVGCVLYEMLAGRRPFVAEMPEAMMLQHLNDQPPPLQSLRQGLPAELCTLVSELMAKDVLARPEAASEVVTRLAEVRAEAEAAESRRLTVRPGDRDLESARATVLIGEPATPAPAVRPAEAAGALWRQAAGSAAEQAAGSAAAQAAGSAAEQAAGSAAAPSAAGPAVRAAQVAAEPGPGLVRFGPGLSASAPAPVPEWTKPPRTRRRRRRLWPRVLSTAVTLAVIAAVGVVLWIRAHETLNVSAVAVAPASLPGSSCNVTVDVVGTVFTNTHGGQIQYQWIRNGTLTSPVQTAIIASGQTKTQLHLSWAFHGTGTYRATAELRMLSPQVTSAQTAFTYSCP